MKSIIDKKNQKLQIIKKYIYFFKNNKKIYLNKAKTFIF